MKKFSLFAELISCCCVSAVFLKCLDRRINAIYLFLLGAAIWIAVTVVNAIHSAIMADIKNKHRNELQEISNKIVDMLSEQKSKCEQPHIPFELLRKMDNKKPEGYLLWKCFAYWLGNKYLKYECGFETAKAFNELAIWLYGEKTMESSKLVALNEILNRSTKLYLDENKNVYKEFPKEKADDLFDFIDKIADSMYEDAYKIPINIKERKVL